jgi:hypothetical protein
VVFKTTAIDHSAIPPRRRSRRNSRDLGDRDFAPHGPSRSLSLGLISRSQAQNLQAIACHRKCHRRLRRRPISHCIAGLTKLGPIPSTIAAIYAKCESSGGIVRGGRHAVSSYPTRSLDFISEQTNGNVHGESRMPDSQSSQVVDEVANALSRRSLGSSSRKRQPAQRTRRLWSGRCDGPLSRSIGCANVTSEQDGRGMIFLRRRPTLARCRPDRVGARPHAPRRLNTGQSAAASPHRAIRSQRAVSPRPADGDPIIA